MWVMTQLVAAALTLQGFKTISQILSQFSLFCLRGILSLKFIFPTRIDEIKLYYILLHDSNQQ